MQQNNTRAHEEGVPLENLRGLQLGARCKSSACLHSGLTLVSSTPLKPDASQGPPLRVRGHLQWKAAVEVRTLLLA